MKVLAEPKKALTKEKVKLALEMDSGHNFLGMFSSGSSGTTDDTQS